MRELRKAELEIERLTDENKYLSAQLATKAEKSRQASENGKKGPGYPAKRKISTKPTRPLFCHYISDPVVTNRI